MKDYSIYQPRLNRSIGPDPIHRKYTSRLLHSQDAKKDLNISIMVEIGYETPYIILDYFDAFMPTKNHLTLFFYHIC